jgi:hypothetical protein
VKKIHVAFVALLLGLAGVLGTFAVTRTVGVGAATTRAQDAAIAKRVKQLNAFQASLERQLAAKTTPKHQAAPAPRVVYHRPPPIVVVHHSAQHEDEGEREGSDD